MVCGLQSTIFKQIYMRRFLTQIILRNIFISCIWITFPLGIILTPSLTKKTVELKSQLTPYSVPVQGYFRNNNSYVNSHSRRPPGSVDHDKPIKSKIEKYRFFNQTIFLSILISIGVFVSKIWKYIFNFQNEYQIFLFNQIFLKIKNDLISELSFTYSKMLKVKLDYKWTYEKTNINCNRCSEPISQGEFYLDFSFQRLCQSCFEKRSIDSISEILYYMNKFKREYNEINFKIIEIKNSDFPNTKFGLDTIDKYLLKKLVTKNNIN